MEISTPILGIIAYSGTGKTTLLRRLIPLLNDQRLRVGVIKHAHHSFDVDQPGKDSYEFRNAGAKKVLIASKRRWALISENSDAVEPTLKTTLVNLPDQDLDLILVEGFKNETFPKIELRRSRLDSPQLYPKDNSVIAIATDTPPECDVSIPVLDLNRPDQIAAFIVKFVTEWRSVSSISG